MKKAVITNKIYLNYDKDLFDKLSEHLTFKFGESDGSMLVNQTVEEVRLAKRIGTKAITMPTGCINYIPEDFEVVDKRIDKKIKFPEFKETLRDNQKEVYDQVNGSCLIKANPGWGKTFTAIALAKKFSMKTLIIVHKAFLRDQWVEEVEKSLGFTPGIIGGGKFETEPPIVIATIQTLHKRAKELRDVFGAIFIDETHKCLAKMFINTMQEFNASIKIGLSATLGRKDGKHIMFEHLFGPDLYEGEVDNEMVPTIHIWQMPISIPGNASVPWGSRVTKLFENDNFLQAVWKIIDSYLDKGYVPLVVMPRIDAIEKTHEIFPTLAKVTGKTEDRMQIKDKILSGELQGVISESSIFTEGISVNILNCLINTLPTNNPYLLEQLIGRITRPHPGKEDTIAVDIAYSGGTGWNQLNERMSYYRDRKYIINKITV